MGQTKDLAMNEREQNLNEQFNPTPSTTDLITMVQGVAKAPTQKTISDTINNIVDLTKEGHIDPLRMVVMMKALTEVFEGVRKGITSNVLDELQKYTKGELAESLGAKIDRMEAGTTYDFTNCNDVGWELMTSQVNGLKERIKENANESCIRDCGSLEVKIK